MKSSKWGIAAGGMLMMVSGVGWLLLGGACRAAEQSEPDEARQAADLRGPTGARSMWRSSWLPTTGKPNQIVQLVCTDAASASDAISVEVYDQGGTPCSWSRVTSLSNAGPDSRVYELQPLHDGTVLIRFGDGTHGARPPAAERGVRVRHVGGDGQTAALRAGKASIRRVGATPYARGSVWMRSAERLRQHAGKRVFEVITLQPTSGDEMTYTVYEVPGDVLHVFLTESSEWLARGETVVSVGVRD